MILWIFVHGGNRGRRVCENDSVSPVPSRFLTSAPPPSPVHVTLSEASLKEPNLSPFGVALREPVTSVYSPADGDASFPQRQGCRAGTARSFKLAPLSGFPNRIMIALRSRLHSTGSVAPNTTNSDAFPPRSFSRC